VQNHLLIWLDPNIDESIDFYQNAITQLRTIIDSVSTFSDLDQCVDYLTDVVREKIFMIISEDISEQVVPCIHDISELDTIYIFSNNEFEQEHLFIQWPKVKTKCTQIISIGKAIRQAVERCDRDSIPISFVSADDGTSDVNLDELDSSFMYTQVLKEILLNEEYNEQSIKDLVNYWRPLYIGNNKQLKFIDEFKRDYRSDMSIWWYTRDVFIYGILNRALRTLEADVIIKMGFSYL
jgi:hypothetical protein